MKMLERFPVDRILVTPLPIEKTKDDFQNKFRFWKTLKLWVFQMQAQSKFLFSTILHLAFPVAL